MTREEEIRKRVNELIFAYKTGPLSIEDVLTLMAQWADEHLMYIHTDNEQVIANLQAEIERLRNPWRDAKKELPKDKCKVLVLYGDECEVVHFKNGEFICIATDQQKYLGEAMVMIDGELVEKPIFSGPQREHITDIVTHWMPIPELKGGEQ